MGRLKENPRYNVMSFRASEEERAEILDGIGACESLGDLLRIAALAYVRQRQANSPFGKTLNCRCSSVPVQHHGK